MKKSLSIILSLVLVSAMFAGCSKKSDNSINTSSVKKDSSIADKLPGKIKDAGKITIGLDDSYPPMEFRDDTNTLVGFDIDFGNAIGKKLGVKVVWEPTAWDGILAALKSSKFDMIISALSVTPEREKEILFSDPYIQGGPIIVTTKDNSSIKTGDDLKGKTIGVQLGTTADDAVSSMNGIKEVTRYDKVTDALQDLANGRLAAVVADDQVGRYYVGLSPEKFITTGKLNDEPFGIGFRQEDKELRDAVQAAIDALKADGTLSKISEKWFKTDIYKK